MRYKNVSEADITIERVSVKAQTLETSSLVVKPGEEFVTSPRRAAALLKSGKIEKVTGKQTKTAKPAASSKKKEQAS